MVLRVSLCGIGGVCRHLASEPSFSFS